MQHLTSEQLLDLDDRIGSSFEKERSHLKTCTLCRREHQELKMRRLQLKALPQRTPSRSAWPRVEKSFRRRRATRTIAKYTAVVALSVSFGLIAYEYNSSRAPKSTLPSELVAESQELELTLKKLDGNTVTDIRRASEIVALEEQIADVDEQIAAFQSAGQSQQSTPLWRARIDLLHTVLQVHQSMLFLSL